jgi:transposase
MAEMAHQRHELLGPMAPQLEQLLSMPGVKAITARDLGAAMGLDMTRFGSAARLSAWAGGAPGNQDRAGKRRRGRARKGNRSLRRVVGPWAWAPRETSTFVGRTFRRLEARVGGKKAAMVVAQKIVVIISQLLLEGTLYEEEGTIAWDPDRRNVNASGPSRPWNAWATRGPWTRLPQPQTMNT